MICHYFFHVKASKLQQFLKLLLTGFFLPLRKKCPYSELFWSAFSRIRTEYGEILSYSVSYSVRMQTRITRNTDAFYAVYPLFSMERG